MISKEAIDTVTSHPLESSLIAEFTREEPLDESTLGPVLQEVRAWFHAESDSREKVAMQEWFTGPMLERMVHDAARGRWNMEHSEAVADIYCHIGTLEKVFGDEQAYALRQSVISDMLYGRSFDDAADVGLFKLPKPSIFLSNQGHEVGQHGYKAGMLTVEKELGVVTQIMAYYRSRGIILGDVKNGFMSYFHALAELYRKGETGGVDLSVFGPTFMPDGDIRIHHGVPNVGGGVEYAVGVALRQRAIQAEKEDIHFDSPKRSDIYRFMQLTGPVSSAVATVGGGAQYQVLQALHYAQTARLPFQLVLEPNRWAIGTKEDEVAPHGQLWKLGHAAEVPGVSIAKEDLDGAILAGRFGTLWTAYDAGPIVLELSAIRPKQHSGAHGNPAIVELVSTIREKAAAVADTLTVHQQEALASFLASGLPVNSRLDSTVNAATRVQKFIAENDIEGPLRETLLACIDGIDDPVEVVISKAIASGVTTSGAIEGIRQEATENMGEVVDTVLDWKDPNPEKAGRYHAHLAPDIAAIRESGSVPIVEEEITLSGAQVQSRVLTGVMKDNPHVQVMGVDVNVGGELTGDGHIKPKGSYLGQTTGLWGEYASEPFKVSNMPIAEKLNQSIGFGVVTQPSKWRLPDRALNEALMRGELNPSELTPQMLTRLYHRVFMEGQYADYMLESLPAYMVLASLIETTQGQVVQPIVTTFPEGNVEGGGGKHSNNVIATLLTTQMPVDVYSVSRPSDYYKILNTIMRFTFNPTVLAFPKSMHMRKETFVPGDGLWQPGRDRVVQEGHDLQVITWSAMTPVVEQAIAQMHEDMPEASIGVLEKLSWRVSGKPALDDLAEYLAGGSGPVLITSENFQNNSPSAHIARWLQDPKLPLRQHMVRDGKVRPVYFLESPDRAEPPCDGVLMNASRPTKEDQVNEMKRILAGSIQTTANFDPAI